ncbi:MAG: asparagine synthase-related protein [Candidatus Omnitrophica bacterium]|nr:asparagine synthase-related protein [Candidatus Omnitrophota bacterium]
MSAIAGLCRWDGKPVDPSAALRMVRAMPHRCPDGVSGWADESAALAHGLLRCGAADAAGTAPTVSRDGSTAVTADARFDNRQELLSQLALPAGSDLSDGGLMIAAYRRWGEEFIRRLAGDFAFCLWDRRKRIVLCGRDHLGVKPFYYYAGGRFFAFSSEIKGLWSLEGIPRRLNETRIADYLHSLLEDAEATFFQEILRLPPAHLLIVSPFKKELRRYWEVRSASPVCFRNDADYEEAFLSVFQEAVRCRLRGVSKAGVLLSGGLDSSGVAAVAAAFFHEEGRGSLPVFSATFEQVPESDEQEFSRQVVSDGMRLHRVAADRISPLADLDSLLFHQDEPFYAPNLFMHWALFRSGREAGVRVMLDGLDGDTTVCHATARLTELLGRGRWTAFIRESRLFAGRHDRPFGRVIWEKGFRPYFLRAVHLVRRPRRVGMVGHEPIIHPELERRTGYRLRAFRLRRGRWDPSLSVRDEHHRRLTSGMIPFVLEVADRTAAPFCLEARYPFFDKRVVEFCYGLPSGQKFLQGWTRSIERRAFTRVLPAPVCWRAKKGNLGPNFDRALAKFERQRVNRLIMGKIEVLEPYVSMEVLRRVGRRFLDSGSSLDAMGVWKALTLGLWLERFHGGGSPDIKEEATQWTKKEKTQAGIASRQTRQSGELTRHPA